MTTAVKLSIRIISTCLALGFAAPAYAILSIKPIAHHVVPQTTAISATKTRSSNTNNSNTTTTAPENLNYFLANAKDLQLVVDGKSYSLNDKALFKLKAVGNLIDSAGKKIGHVIAIQLKNGPQALSGIAVNAENKIIGTVKLHQSDSSVYSPEDVKPVGASKITFTTPDILKHGKSKSNKVNPVKLSSPNKSTQLNIIPQPATSKANKASANGVNVVTPLTTGAAKVNNPNPNNSYKSWIRPFTEGGIVVGGIAAIISAISMMLKYRIRKRFLVRASTFFSRIKVNTVTRIFG